MPRAKQSMDGNTAAAHVAYAYTDVAAIYPITPSSPPEDSTAIIKNGMLTTKIPTTLPVIVIF